MAIASTTPMTVTTLMATKTVGAAPHAPVCGAAADAALQAPALERLEENLGIAAHEMRNPLTGGMLAVDLATDDMDGLRAYLQPQGDAPAGQLASLQRHLMQVASSLERLARLVDDLTDASRIRSGQLTLRLAPCDLTRVVRETVVEQQLLVPNRVIRLRVPARPLAPILADGDRIRQVVTNYLTNALRYAPADRPVDVRLQRQGRWVRVSVRDEGQGVPYDQRQRIWERFHRVAGVHGTSQTYVRTNAGPGYGLGLGLGLHLCKTIVEQHQGKVGVHSVPGSGSTFWFALPLDPPDGSGTQRRARSDELPPTSSSHHELEGAAA